MGFWEAFIPALLGMGLIGALAYCAGRVKGYLEGYDAAVAEWRRRDEQRSAIVERGIRRAGSAIPEDVRPTGADGGFTRTAVDGPPAGSPASSITR